MDFCEEIRRKTDVYWEASFKHPFVQGIANGTLPLEKFKFYMMQDAYYLKHYTKILALSAAKATEEEHVQYFLKTAQFIHEAELELHRTTFKQLHVTEDDFAQFKVAPATYNYVNHLYHAVHNGGVEEAFAALVPCPWLYQEIGQKIKTAQPEQALYREWIALYSSDEMVQTVAEQREILNHFARNNTQKQGVLRDHFERSCYYELLFWDMAWTGQSWTGDVKVYESAKD